MFGWTKKSRLKFPKILFGVAAGISALCMPLVVSLPTKVVWNASSSVPQGLYSVRSVGGLRQTDLVVMKLPANVAKLADRRHYLPVDVPLIKPIAALSGQTVCRFGANITIDGTWIAQARSADRLRRPMPVWSGCERLKSDQIFVLNAAEPDSFDGRYFGVSERDQVIGQATAVFTYDAATGRYRFAK